MSSALTERTVIMKRIPIVIDVDTGTDDAICINAALLCQDLLDIRAFASVCGNVELEKTSRNTRDVVGFLGEDIPVARGAERPLAQELHTARSHGVSGLGDVVLPTSTRPFMAEPAWEVIYRCAVEAQGELQLLGVGPLTNIALSIQHHPDIVPLIRKITIMGGCLRGGNMTMASEFNIYGDPEAAQIVFSSGIELCMVGLDVTPKPQLPDWVVEAVNTMHSPHAQLAAKIFSFMRRRQAEIGGDPPNVHDVIALSAIVCPRLITCEDYYIVVETEGEFTRGMTLADFSQVSEQPPNVHAAVAIDVEGFWNWFLQTLQKAE